MSENNIDNEKPNSNTENIKDKMSKVKDTIINEPTVDPVSPTILEEKISHNAKIILLSLFLLVGFIVALGSFVIYAKLDVSVEVLTIIFSTAITGCFTLGGVLINAIWGK
jgi:hypothetical protein